MDRAQTGSDVGFKVFKCGLLVLAVGLLLWVYFLAKGSMGLALTASIIAALGGITQMFSILLNREKG